jgi:hypothetical protein
MACILEDEGRGHDSVEGRQVDDTTTTIRMRWRIKSWEMTQLGRVGRMVG